MGEASRTIDFKVADQFMDGPTYAAATAPSPKINVNGMWFQNNGLSAKVGEKSLLQRLHLLEQDSRRTGHHSL